MRVSAAVFIAGLAWATAAAADDPAPAPYQPVELGQFETELPSGARWLDEGYGLLCISRESQIADGARKPLPAPGAQETFQRELARAGLKASAPAGEEPSSAPEPADLVVSGVVTALHEELCTPLLANPALKKGKISMQVEWRLYSKSRNAVVASTQVHVERSVGLGRGAADVLLGQAFADAVRQMAADPTIRQALAGGATPGL